MNTKISYLYRDGDNYKSWNEAIVSGTLTSNDIQRIIECLDSGEFFVPSVVGLPEKRFDDGLTEADHIWFELCAGSFESTEAAPTVLISAQVLLRRFLAAAGHWEDKPTTRMFELASKLYIPDNEYCRGRLAGWISKALDYAAMMFKDNEVQKDAEGYQVRFLMNHICPNLVHLCPKPRFINSGNHNEDMAEFNRMSSAYQMENTQAGFSSGDTHIVIQDGLHYTSAELARFMEIVTPLLRPYFIFTFGAAVPFDKTRKSGYVHVYASDMVAAKEAFRGKHPDEHRGVLHCEDYYTQAEWESKKDARSTNCLEVISAEEKE